MKANLLRERIAQGALSKYQNIYANPKEQEKRYLDAIDAFTREFGEDRDIRIFSVPGRSEISGNHTDHNRGKVLAGAIDRDIIAIAAKNDDGHVRIHSEGYPLDDVALDQVDNKTNYSKYSSQALIAGTCQEFKNRGYNVGGYDAYTTTQVLKGSGISSSAAFEVQVGNIMSHLYNNGAISNVELAKIAQYAENEYFGKPCGLMDQMACAVGGFLSIDFEDPKNPIITPISFSLSDAGYNLCIVNTGGNHADLNEDYASVPKEMKEIAKYFGKEVLREVDVSSFFDAIPTLRGKYSDRSILRAIHFFSENDRVTKQVKALQTNDLGQFLALVNASGNSSFKYLQNVYTNKNVEEQGLSLALALTDKYLSDTKSACRVHGGGFAGTIQAFVPKENANNYVQRMNSVFGENSVLLLLVRPVGATEIQL